MSVVAYDDNNIFAKIIRGEVTCDKVYEDDSVLAFNDINPIAKFHIIVIPKDRFVSYDDFIESSSDVLHFFRTIKKVADILELTDCGYRLISNHGANSGQEIFHFHVHIVSNG